MNDHSDPRVRRAAELPVPWDEVRQRRVLGRIEGAVLAGAQGRRRRRWVGAGGGLAAAAAAVVVALVLPSIPAEAPIAMPTAGSEAIAVAPIPSIPFATWPELRLPDRSRAQLRHGARVDVEVQSAELVRLVQHSGEVRYEVTPDRTRSFLVDAAGIEVRVIGTIFTVTVEEHASRVAVSVERGLVEVDNGTRVAELGPGDALSLDVEDDDEIVFVDPDPDPSTRPAVRPAAPSIETLLADADAARAGGNLPRAAAALHEVVRRYPKDPRAYSAHFQLGKVERARGRHAAAAAAFTRCWKRSPSGALAEDARAEAAVAWQAAGHVDQARATALGYLDRYPGGTHHGRMARLLAELP